MKKTTSLALLILAMFFVTRPLYGQGTVTTDNSAAHYAPALQYIPYIDNIASPYPHDITLASTSLYFSYSTGFSFGDAAAFSNGISIISGDLSVSSGNFSLSGTSTFSGLATFSATPYLSTAAISLDGTVLSKGSGSHLFWGSTDISAGSSILTDISSGFYPHLASQTVYNLPGIFNPGTDGSSLFLGSNNTWEPIAWNAYPVDGAQDFDYSGTPAAQIAYYDWNPNMLFQFSSNTTMARGGNVTWLTGFTLWQNGNADFGTTSNTSDVSVFGQVLVKNSSGTTQFSANNTGDLFNYGDATFGTTSNASDLEVYGNISIINSIGATLFSADNAGELFAYSNVTFGTTSNVSNVTTYGEIEVNNSSGATEFSADNTGNLFANSGATIGSTSNAANLNVFGELFVTDNSNALQFRVNNTGDIYARSLQLDLDAITPDYVFAKDYKLMPLDTLQAYVQANSHLPEVPSAGELECSGKVDVGNMQMELLKKVEELTLYTIELNEQVQALKEQNDKLQAKINK